MTKTKKKVIISMISIIILCLVLVISKSYSLTKKHSNNILKEKGSYISFTVDGASSNNAFPSKRTGYIANSVSCTNGTTATWDNEKWGLVNIVSNNKNKINCNVDFHYDGQAPSLTLDKTTYIEDDLSTWTLSNAYIDGDKVVAGTNGSVASLNKCYDVNYGKFYLTFDAYTSVVSSYGETRGSVYVGTSYKDENNNSTTDTTSGHNYSGNGWRKYINVNTWTSLTHDYGLSIYGFKYGCYSIINYPSSDSVPFEIRNIKFYSNIMTNNFYIIKVISSDNEGVTETKYASGSQTAEYFRTSGDPVTDNRIRVTTNGIYTVYVRDAVGNETIRTIEITNIV